MAGNRGTRRVQGRMYGFNGTSWRRTRIDSSTDTTQTIDYAHHEVHSGSHYYVQGFKVLGLAEVFRVKLDTHDSTKEVHFLYEITSSLALTTTFDEGCVGGMAGGLRPTIHASNRNKECYSGIHTGGNGEATVMTDANANSGDDFTVDALIGATIYNTTDSSSAIITDNDANTVTVAALVGGTDNDWDTSDKYEINNSKTILTSGVAVATTYDQRLESESWGVTEKKLLIGGGGARGDELVLRGGTTHIRTFTTVLADNLLQFRAAWYEHTPKDA
jgi:hypothetical protein